MNTQERDNAITQMSNVLGSIVDVKKINLEPQHSLNVIC